MAESTSSGRAGMKALPDEEGIETDDPTREASWFPV